MKNTLKTFLALLMSLLMVLSFAACGGDSAQDANPASTTEEPADEKKVAQSDEEAVEEVLVAFAEKVIELDSDALDYVDDSSELYDMLKDMGYDKDPAAGMVSQMLDVTPVPDGYADDFEELMIDFIEKAFAKIDTDSIRVSEIEVDGDKASAMLQMSMPDYSVLYDIDFDQDAIMSYFTEEQLAEMAEAVESMTDEEAEEYGIEMVMEIMPQVFEDMLDEVKYSDSLAEYDLEKVDGEWLIVKEY